MSSAQMKSTYEAAHAWANKTQEEGQGSGFSFKGDLFYSGESPIAKRIDNSVVFSSTSFGMTATKQRMEVEQATRGFKQVFVPFCELTLDENIIEANALIQSLLLKASTATVKKSALVEEAKSVAKAMNEFGALQGQTSEVIPMHQFNTLDFTSLKAQARAHQMANLAKAKKRVARSAKKISYRLVDAHPEKVTAHTPRIATRVDTNEGLTLSNAFILLDGLHNMTGAGISIEEDIHVNIQLPARIAPSGNITVGGQAITYDKLQQVRNLLGVQ